jgi:hypothetical protein
VARHKLAGRARPDRLRLVWRRVKFAFLRPTMSKQNDSTLPREILPNVRDPVPLGWFSSPSKVVVRPTAIG